MLKLGRLSATPGVPTVVLTIELKPAPVISVILFNAIPPEAKVAYVVVPAVFLIVNVFWFTLPVVAPKVM